MDPDCARPTSAGDWLFAEQARQPRHRDGEANSARRGKARQTRPRHAEKQSRTRAFWSSETCVALPFRLPSGIRWTKNKTEKRITASEESGIRARSAARLTPVHPAFRCNEKQEGREKGRIKAKRSAAQSRTTESGGRAGDRTGWQTDRKRPTESLLARLSRVAVRLRSHFFFFFKLKKRIINQ